MAKFNLRNPGKSSYCMINLVIRYNGLIGAVLMESPCMIVDSTIILYKTKIESKKFYK